MPSIIFGGGKVDITDRVNRLLGQLNIIATVDGSKVVASDSIPYIGNIKKAYINVPIIEFINSPPKANLVKKYIMELDGVIHYVEDYRHSQNLDHEDTTYFGDTSAGLTIDYNSVITFKHVYIKCETTSNNTSFGITISQDNVTYRSIFGYAGARMHHLNFFNLEFRYLRFQCGVVTAGQGPAGFKVYKIILVK
jgi:hypothetical protein